MKRDKNAIQLYFLHIGPDQIIDHLENHICKFDHISIFECGLFLLSM